MTMFYQGSLQDGITLAVREAKAVVCFVRGSFPASFYLSMYGGSMQMLTAGLQRIRSSAPNGSLNTSARTR